MSKNNNRQNIDVEKDAKTTDTTSSTPSTSSTTSAFSTLTSGVSTTSKTETKAKTSILSTPVPNAVEPAVTDILNDKTTTLKDKLYAVSKLDSQCGALAKKLIEYEEKMGTNAGDIDVRVGASNNVSLYNTINRVINTVGGLEFNQKFQIVNIAFLVFKDSAYSVFKLNRFDYQWTYGQDNLQTFRNLIMLISELADITTRQEKVRQISWARVFTPKGFRSIGKNNLKRFYEM